MYSPSEISLYLKCPRAYKYYKLKYFEVKSPATEFGSYIHEVIKRYYENLPKDITPSKVPYLVYKYVDDNDAEKSWVFNNFIKWEQNRIQKSWKLICVERKFVKEPFKGIVDAMFRYKNNTIVVDWKTSFMSEITDDYLIQGHIYKTITDADEVYFMFLRSNKFVKFDDDVERFKELFLKFVNGVNSRYFERNKSPFCDICSYKYVCLLNEVGVHEQIL